MDVVRHTVPACCGKVAITFKIDRSISKDLIATLSNLGFIEDVRFTKAGLLYMHNSEFIMSGAIGSDKLQVKCKLKDCAKLDDLENLLKNIP